MEYDKIREQLKARLETVNDPAEFVTVFDRIPDSITPPVAMIVPASSTVTYHESMGGIANGLIVCRFEIQIIEQRFSSDFSQERLDEYMATVPAAIEGAQTLGGYASSVQITTARNYGPVTFGSELYLGVQFDCEVLAA